MIVEKSINNKDLKLEWSVEQDTITTLEELYAKQEVSSNSVDVLFFVNDRVVGKAEIEDLTILASSIVFDLNLEAVPIVFWVSVLVTAKNTKINKQVQTNPRENTLVLTEEKKKINLKGKYLTCGLQEKTAKIEPEFEWIGDLNNGVTLLMTTDLITTWKQFKPFYWEDTFILTITFEDYIFSSSKFQILELFYDTMFSGCYCIKHHGDFTGVTRGTTPKCAFEAPTAVLTKVATSTAYTYTYIVVAVTARRLIISQEVQIPSAPPLGDNDYVTLTWTAVSDAIEYRIYRITSTGNTITSGLIGIVEIVPPATEPALTYTDTQPDYVYVFESTDAITHHAYLKARKYRWKLTVTLPNLEIETRTGIVTVRES
jgi:hypothetical protein